MEQIEHYAHLVATWNLVVAFDEGILQVAKVKDVLDKLGLRGGVLLRPLAGTESEKSARIIDAVFKELEEFSDVAILYVASCTSDTQAVEFVKREGGFIVWFKGDGEPDSNIQVHQELDKDELTGFISDLRDLREAATG